NQPRRAAVGRLERRDGERADAPSEPGRPPPVRNRASPRGIGARGGPLGLPGRGAKRSQSPAPSEANPPRQTNPIPRAERTRGRVPPVARATGAPAPRTPVGRPTGGTRRTRH